MRHYRSRMVDSRRWHRFTFRPDDVVISTPSKCGTTWMQSIVGMLLLGRTDLGAPIGSISPWLDANLVPVDEVVAMLDAQQHRRFLKTHTPLDGFWHPAGVTVITVIRHPLDVALSFRGHRSNADQEQALRLVTATGTDAAPRDVEPEPEDDAEYLRWWVDREEAHLGSGPYGLLDYCHQVRQCWDARNDPDIALFHYSDLWSDLVGEVRAVAAVLGVTPEEDLLTAIVEAATLESMRSRAERTAPHAELGIWLDPAEFFRTGGTHPWRELMTDDDLAHFARQLHDLAGDATDWILTGRAALG